MRKDTIPLQVADFVAWETRRLMTNLQEVATGKSDYAPPREPYEIISKKAHAGKYMMTRQLVQLCAEYGVTRRTVPRLAAQSECVGI